MPTKTGGVFEGLPEFAAIHVKLFGNTADIDAGAAQIKPFRYDDFCTQAGGNSRGSDTA